MPPGPEVARHTPSLPVNFAYPQAMKAPPPRGALGQSARDPLACGGLHDSVDPIAGKTEDDLDSPVLNRFDEYVGCCRGCHGMPPSSTTLGFYRLKATVMPAMRASIAYKYQRSS